MGGSKKKSPVVALCHSHHEMVTLHECSDDILEINGVLTYVYFDLHGKALIERPVGSAGAEGEDKVTKVPSGRQEPLGSAEVPEPLEARSEGQPLASAPPAGEKEEGDGQVDGLRYGRTSGRDMDVGSNSIPLLTHEQRVAIAQEIHDTEYQRQWRAGDTANQWREELGEEAEQYLDDFGYVQESLANIMRVCAAIPENIRRENLRFSHHVVVAGENREDMEMWLDKCEAEQWSVAEFRRVVHGVKPRVQRWSAKELYDAASRWGGDAPEFVGWLEAQ
jgi:hypothetical protein